MPDLSSLIASIVFGTIGFAAFVYGKRAMNWTPMAIGVALMVYPYFVGQGWPMYLVGVMLTVSLFVFRE
ncbi:MAG: hypothetical protein HY306_09680 [Nitrosomonadales bacterium]|nr:hypothetical protein [Nitrosomonadales bacterium]